MTLPLYSIQPDGDCFQVCLVFRDDILPIPGKRYTSYEVARLVVKTMESEDYRLWKMNFLNPQAEIQDHE